MTFLVQNNDGTIAGANAYMEVQEFKDYHTDRGNSYTSSNDTAIQKAIVKATDYLDQRFSFVGTRRMGREQSTEWPRNSARDRDGYYVNDIPPEVKEATAEYALRALTAELLVDPDQDATGAKVQSKTEKVGPLEESTTYVSGAVYSLPKYPVADQRLIKTGLTRRGGDVKRA